MNFRYDKNHKRFLAIPKHDYCDFCQDEATLQRIIRTTEHAYVIPNLVPYDIWELHDVVDHLMVIPKRHVHSLNELKPAEQADIMSVLAEYEAKEYNIYARATNSVRRSVSHQHTHLIKISPKPPRFHVYIDKPHYLIKF